MKKILSIILATITVFYASAISVFAANVTVDGVVYSQDKKQLIECTTNYSSGNVFTVPEGVEEICSGAFMNNSEIIAIIMPSTLKKISSDAFKNAAIKDIDMSKCEKLSNVASSAFENCENMKSISFPMNVSTVGENVFKNCTSLQYIEIPEIIIPDSCLIGCTSLQRVAVKITQTKRTLYETGKMTIGAEKVTASDARTVLRISAKIEISLAYTIFSADVNRDGKISASDARKVLRVAAHLDSF